MLHAQNIHSEQGSTMIELVLATIGALIVLAGIFASGSALITSERVHGYSQDVVIVTDRVKALRRTSSNNAQNNNYLLLNNAFLIANSDLPTGMINGANIENSLSGNISVSSGNPLLATFYVTTTIPKDECVDAVLDSWKISEAKDLRVNAVAIAQNSIAQPQISMAALLGACVLPLNTLIYKIKY